MRFLVKDPFGQFSIKVKCSFGLRPNFKLLANEFLIFYCTPFVSVLTQNQKQKPLRHFLRGSHLKTTSHPLAMHLYFALTRLTPRETYTFMCVFGPLRNNIVSASLPPPRKGGLDWGLGCRVAVHAPSTKGFFFFTLPLIGCLVWWFGQTRGYLPHLSSKGTGNHTPKPPNQTINQGTPEFVS